MRNVEPEGTGNMASRPIETGMKAMAKVKILLSVSGGSGSHVQGNREL